MMSTARKSLRYFKTLSVLRKFVLNTLRQPSRLKQALMALGDASALCYYICDHLLVLADVSLLTLDPMRRVHLRWLKNVFSFCRLLISFALDSLAMQASHAERAALLAMREQHPDDSCAVVSLVEETAITAVERRLVRNFVANSANMLVLLASLGMLQLGNGSLGALGLVSAWVGCVKVFVRLE